MRSRAVRRGIVVSIAVCAAAAAAAAVGESPPSTAGDNGKAALRALSVELSAGSRSARDAALALASAGGWKTRLVAPDGRLMELQGLQRGLPLFYATENDMAARTVRADSVRLSIGGGAGFTIGLWDGDGCRVTHRELAPRASWDDPSTYGDAVHATHVAGILIGAGVDPRARGMAPEAGVSSYEWTNDLGEMAAAAGDGLLISNHSYGHVRGWYTSADPPYWFGDVEISETEDYLFGFYSEETRGWDEVLHAAPHYLAVVSAGNDRNDTVEPGTRHRYWDPASGNWAYSTAARDADGGDDGFDCLPDGNGTAKNTLVVSAVEDVPEYGGPDSVVAAWFSSAGPTDDGRIKPDISGNGVALYSASSSSDSSYATYSGTSMASPNVCGSLALLQDYYADTRGEPMRGATLKALALHTAREAGPAPGPDYLHGWGLLDALAALRLVQADGDGTRGLIGELTLLEGEEIELYYESDGAEPLRATICWADPPGIVPEPALNNRAPRLVNDLDLRLVGDATHLPWVLDPDAPSAPAARGDNVVDNVEQVVVDEPVAGVYVLRIAHKGSLEDGTQPVSLVVSGAARARTWHVFADGSGDVPDLAAAVAIAAPGDQVFLFPGVHAVSGLVVDKPLLIAGTGSREETILDAGGADRCLVLDAAGGEIELSTFTVRGGVAPGGDRGRGGGLLVRGRGASISNCVVTGCEAGEGGGIAAVLGDPAISGCLVTGNRAGRGGGIFLSAADATVSRCVISGNTATVEGGGLLAVTCKPLFEGLTVRLNEAPVGGGVMAGEHSHVTVLTSIVAANEGGGMHAARFGSATVSCSDLWGNGGGDWTGMLRDETGTDGNISADPVFCSDDPAVADIADSSPCRATGNSCGVLMGAGQSVCHARSYWYVRPDGAGDLPTIQDAIDEAVPGDTVLLAPGTYRGSGNRDINFMGKRIVVRSAAGPELTVIDCSSATGDEYAGFFFNHGEDTTSILSGVTVTNASYCGIEIDDASPLVENCIIRGCRNVGGFRGGGIYVRSSSAVIRDCVVTGNEASPNGGGMTVSDADVLVERCVIEGNRAVEYGGGVVLRSHADVTLRDCRIENNTSGASAGGGVHSLYSDLVVENCVVTGNHAGSIGGGLYNGMSATCAVSGTIIAFNTASNAGGGVYSSANLLMENCTVAGNSSPWYGSGIELYDGEANAIGGSIIAFNGPAEGLYSISGTADISCCDVYGNEGGDYGGATTNQTGMNGNISADPLFCDADAGFFGLLDGSPCLPEGNPCGLVGARGAGCGDLPNLVVATTRASKTEAAVGDTVTVDVVVRNDGVSPADTFAVSLGPFEYGDGEGAVAGEPYAVHSEIVSGLAPGRSETVRFILVAGEPSVFYGTAVVDPDNRIAESDDGDNAGPSLRIEWGAAAEDEFFTQIRYPRPNPTTGETDIVFEIRERCPVLIVVYDIAGRRVRTLRHGAVGAGRHHATWDGRNEAGRMASPGFYFVRFRAGAVDRTRKIVVIR